MLTYLSDQKIAKRLKDKPSVSENGEIKEGRFHVSEVSKFLKTKTEKETVYTF